MSAADLLQSTLAFLAQHPAYVTVAGVTALHAVHPKLSKWPFAQTLVRYAAVYPVIRLALVELAQAILVQWGPDAASPPLVAAQAEVVEAVQHVAEAKAADGPDGVALHVLPEPAPEALTFGDLVKSKRADGVPVP